jgi:NB-ARC domain
MLVPIERMWDRVEIARQDSDTALFLHLMYTAEQLVKLACTGLVATLCDDVDRHRYRLSHRLVRADGIGEWSAVLDEILTGPASQCLPVEAKTEQRELTQKCSAGEWQHEAVVQIDSCLRLFDSQREGFPFKLEGKRWFLYFTELRNRTRAHGATSPSLCSQLCPPLERSIRLISDNFSLLRREWAYLHKNLSGKYRVTKLSETDSQFAILKGSRIPDDQRSLHDGIYIHIDSPCRVDLLESDADATDFFFPNGAFTDTKYELISYLTDSRRNGDSTRYSAPATALPRSETHGLGQLDVQGSVFGNVPPIPNGYVNRIALQRDLRERLVDDRHPIVTLVGRGGIGKTALALSVLHEVESLERFGAAVWLSARDIDLLPEGPKLVSPDVLSLKDMAKEFVRLMEPADAKAKGFDAVAYFGNALTESPVGFPTIFVFDNFETVRGPGDLYAFLDTHIRLPNKILITTRSRDFKADFPVEVTGMTEEESEKLIDVVAESLEISQSLTPEYRGQLIRESDGHPYIIKILLGEVAKAKMLVQVQRIVASKDKILDALFERTYSFLSPAAKQVFLTMCNWRSTIPRIALEAVMLRPANERMDVEDAIDELILTSFVEEVVASEDNESILSVPLAASVFGRRKLRASPMITAVQANAALLLNFGAGQKANATAGIAWRIERFFRSVAEKAANTPSAIEAHLPMMEFLAQRYARGWMLLARLYEESSLENGPEKAKGYWRRYLEDVGKSEEARFAWSQLARLCRSREDWIGEIHAIVELCSLDGTTIREISFGLNRWNVVFRQQALYIAGDERQILGRRLLELFEQNAGEANATDFSRAAWVSLALHETERAKGFVRQGLKYDSEDEYCQNLAERLQMQDELPV